MVAVLGRVAVCAFSVAYDAYDTSMAWTTLLPWLLLWMDYGVTRFDWPRYAFCFALPCVLVHLTWLVAWLSCLSCRIWCNIVAYGVITYLV
jgi:hypothetical protein